MAFCACVFGGGGGSGGRLLFTVPVVGRISEHALFVTNISGYNDDTEFCRICDLAPSLTLHQLMQIYSSVVFVTNISGHN